MLIAGLIFMTPAWAQQKPFTQEQVQGMVRSGLGDESGAQLIAKRGIDFEPDDAFLRSLKAAGASEAFLTALRTAKRPPVNTVASKKPLNQVQVFALLGGQVPTHLVAMLVQERGIDFEPGADYLAQVQAAGGDEELVTALKNAKITKPAGVDPALAAQQAEIQRHSARGAEFLQKRQYSEAEAEYRAALLLDPQNADLHVGLGWVLGNKGDWDGVLTEGRETLRLSPNNEWGHIQTGWAQGNKGHWDEAIAENRQVLRLNPNNETAHANLGWALEGKEDWDGAIAEEREAVRLKLGTPLPGSCVGSSKLAATVRGRFAAPEAAASGTAKR